VRPKYVSSHRRTADLFQAADSTSGKRHDGAGTQGVRASSAVGRLLRSVHLPEKGQDHDQLGRIDPGSSITAAAAPGLTAGA